MNHLIEHMCIRACDDGMAEMDEWYRDDLGSDNYIATD